ncbi:pentapeptide repeat-containing protein [Microbispora sp. NEAU-D428]|uniref:pentapeptide repeat-containing protein n=1 Tax=Microbispora sitophila TaxID=2771537 RepID=UPI001866CDF0|nr:pentapeptide repeat-containing protein [Microbispora sitophila]MBE3010955.1 pentapeptide repeat-containing protein [Microbispora sitophila]
MRRPQRASGMSTSERFSLRPSAEEWRHAWIARGELRDQRFELPAGVSSVIFDRARLVNVDFSGTRFAEFIVESSEFEGCDFSGTAFDNLTMGAGLRRRWRGDVWPQSVFRECVFRRTRFASLTSFGNVRFERCVFDRARLRQQTFTMEAEFVDCVFSGRLHDINFWGRPTRNQAALGREHNAFTGNDFTAAELDYVAFKHIDLRAQRWPGPPGYALLDRVSARVTAVLPLVDAWPDAKHRKEARFSLEFLAGKAVEHNDDHAVVSPLDMGRRLPPALREELFEAFRGTSSNTSPG